MSSKKNCAFCEETAMEGSKSALDYKVYPSGGVVKAEVAGTMFDAMIVMNNLVEKANLKTLVLDGIWEETLLNSSYRGKAKVNTTDGDMFSEEIGKEIARGKALEKYHRAFDKKILTMLMDARVLVATIEHYCKKKDIDVSKIPSIEELSKKRFDGYKK